MSEDLKTRKHTKALLFVLAMPVTLLAGWVMAQGTPPSSGPLGSWQGVLGKGSIDLEIHVTFSGSVDALEGTIDIPVQGLFAHPLSDVSLDGDALHFVIAGIPGTPTFDGTLAGDAITGTFTQGGQALHFELSRGEGEATSLRPQEPKPPFPYRSEDVSYANGDVTLAGTLTLPQGDGPFPAALLITGSGAQDRDETLLGHKPFLLIADTLTRAGVAVLRMDDRGVGGSTGSDADATYEDLVGDVLEGVAFLAKRPEIDPQRIGLIGHSQGGFIAPAAADEADASHPVAFVVMIAGPAVSGKDVLILQNERIIQAQAAAADPPLDAAETQRRIDDQVAFLNKVIPLVADKDFDAARKLVADTIRTQLAELPADKRPPADQVAGIVKAQADALVSPSMRSFLTFDPQPFLRRLTVPVLAIYGSHDLQVVASQSVGPLREALTAAGNEDFSIVTFQGLNHLMQPAKTGNPAEYGTIETTMDPIVLQTIKDWVVGRFGNH